MATEAAIPIPSPNPVAVSERAALEVCYRTHRHSVYRLALRYGGGSTGWAEDLTHDVFIKLLEHLPELEDPTHLGGWLYRVTTNMALKRLRRSQSIFTKVVGLLGAGTTPLEAPTDLALEGKEAALAAMRVLETLPPKERVALSMKLIDHRDQNEIAEALSMSESYVSKLLARGMQRLRKALNHIDDVFRAVETSRAKDRGPPVAPVTVLESPTPEIFTSQH